MVFIIGQDISQIVTRGTSLEPFPNLFNWSFKKDENITVKLRSSWQSVSISNEGSGLESKVENPFRINYLLVTTFEVASNGYILAVS